MQSNQSYLTSVLPPNMACPVGNRVINPHPAHLTVSSVYWACSMAAMAWRASCWTGSCRDTLVEPESFKVQMLLGWYFVWRKRPTCQGQIHKSGSYLSVSLPWYQSLLCSCSVTGRAPTFTFCLRSVQRTRAKGTWHLFCLLTARPTECICLWGSVCALLFQMNSGDLSTTCCSSCPESSTSFDWGSLKSSHWLRWCGRSECVTAVGWGIKKVSPVWVYSSLKCVLREFEGKCVPQFSYYENRIIFIMFICSYSYWSVF